MPVWNGLFEGEDSAATCNFTTRCHLILHTEPLSQLHCLVKVRTWGWTVYISSLWKYKNCLLQSKITMTTYCCCLVSYVEDSNWNFKPDEFPFHSRRPPVALQLFHCTKKCTDTKCSHQFQSTCCLKSNVFTVSSPSITTANWPESQMKQFILNQRYESGCGVRTGHIN